MPRTVETLSPLKLKPGSGKGEMGISFRSANSKGALQERKSSAPPGCVARPNQYNGPADLDYKHQAGEFEPSIMLQLQACRAAGTAICSGSQNIVPHVDEIQP